ncbi:MAG: excinuclease ABC subunit UvrB [bacterium]|nr:excinuclease ABC subunit UvrB [bacterium]
MAKFRLSSPFNPTEDQIQAANRLVKGIEDAGSPQVLLGVTGSGKTRTMSEVISRSQLPALIISPNKTLAAQLYQELKEFFPDNAVHYFVSYYDYYQPEAYIPQTNTYIEKDAKVNEIIDRLRHRAVQDLAERKDVIVAASISCIYSIGSPEDYRKISLDLVVGQSIGRRDVLARLTALQYQRNDLEQTPGTFRVRGDTVEVALVTGNTGVRIEFEQDTISAITISEGKGQALVAHFSFHPAKFWVTPQQRLLLAIQSIREELAEHVHTLKSNGKHPEAERLEKRTLYDLEMIEESGYCHGIENYSRHMEFRKPKDPPFTLLDHFPEDRLVFLDESHMTLPQLRAMSVQDKARKQMLIEHGFRLPSAIDNRPLMQKEFERLAPRLIFVSATPGVEEREKSKGRIAEQLIRPTGLLEPTIEIRSTERQLEDLVSEVKKEKERGNRSLVITLTKVLAEETSAVLQERGIRNQWMHGDIKTLERPAILEKLRRGDLDAIVGINLLREGLDLPEVALVIILDADKEGFLRNDVTLIQTMGRAARHPKGRVILYADKVTGSMERAIREIERRRKIQEQHNKEHGITPKPIIKEIRTWDLMRKHGGIEEEMSVLQDKKIMEEEMKNAAANLDFERAAIIRDLIKKQKRGT